MNKKKKDELFVGNKGASNYKSTSVAPKSLGKSKGSRVSQEKTNRHRENATKTQTGFYIIGGGIIPERNDEDHDH